MTPASDAFHLYTQFPEPIPVFSIGENTFYGYGKGTVHLQSLPDPHSTNILQLPDVWYVPGLEESIISKYWTKKHGLDTTLDENENFILTSTTPVLSERDILSGTEHGGLKLLFSTELYRKFPRGTQKRIYLDGIHSPKHNDSR